MPGSARFEIVKELARKPNRYGGYDYVFVIAELP